MSVTLGSRFLQNLKEMNRSTVVLLIAQRLRKKCEAHSIMRVRDGESLRFPEKFPRGGHECLTEDHRRHRESSQQWAFVIKGFGPPTQNTCEKTLMIVRGFSVIVEPTDKPEDRLLYLIDLWILQHFSK
jgi:hypothetical protein